MAKQIKNCTLTVVFDEQKNILSKVSGGISQIVGEPLYDHGVQCDCVFQLTDTLSVMMQEVIDDVKQKEGI